MGARSDGRLGRACCWVYPSVARRSYVPTLDRDLISAVRRNVAFVWRGSGAVVAFEHEAQRSTQRGGGVSEGPARVYPGSVNLNLKSTTIE